MSEPDRAKLFIEARDFLKDEVFARTSTLKSVEDIYAADVMCHKNCVKHYLLKYQRLKESSFPTKNAQDSPSLIEDGSNQYHVFLKVVSELDLERKGYTVSECREMLNIMLPKEFHVDNRKTSRTVSALHIQKIDQNRRCSILNKS